jgi:hypothetical protein
MSDGDGVQREAENEKSTARTTVTEEKEDPSTSDKTPTSGLVPRWSQWSARGFAKVFGNQSQKTMEI